MHVMSASKLHRSTRLNEALGYLRIESQLRVLIRHVEVCFDPRNARLAYVKLRDLDRSGQLRIIERASSARSDRENALYSQVSLLYGLELRQLNSGGIKLKLITFVFRVEDKTGLGRTRWQAQIESSRQCIAVSLELN